MDGKGASGMVESYSGCYACGADTAGRPRSLARGSAELCNRCADEEQQEYERITHSAEAGYREILGGLSIVSAAIVGLLLWMFLAWLIF
jgi:hypothetical protein